MKQITLVSGALYGMFAIILGAFGAHAFKRILSVERLESFETGVKYQMYHALLLLIIGYTLPFDTVQQRFASWCIILGTALFSFSIYGLSFQDWWKISLKFLGPVTPIGGLLMLIGWLLLLLNFIKK